MKNVLSGLVIVLLSGFIAGVLDSTVLSPIGYAIAGIGILVGAVVVGMGLFGAKKIEVEL